MIQKIFLIQWLIALCVSSQTIKINDVPDWDKIPVKVIHRMYQDIIAALFGMAHSEGSFVMMVTL